MPQLGLEALMRSLITLALVAIVSLAVPGAALAQSAVPLDPNPSASTVWGYAQRIGGEVDALEASLKALKGRIPANLSSRLTAVERGLEELQVVVAALLVVPGSTPGAPVVVPYDHQPLLDRLTALEAAVRALPASPDAPDFEAWRVRFESSAATWRAGIERRIATLEAGAAQDRTDITILKADVAALKRDRARIVMGEVGGGYRHFSFPGRPPEGFTPIQVNLGVASAAIGFDLAPESPDRLSLLRFRAEGGGGSRDSVYFSAGVDWCAGRNFSGSSLSLCVGGAWAWAEAGVGQQEHPDWGVNAGLVTLAPRFDMGRHFTLTGDVGLGGGRSKNWSEDGSFQLGMGFALRAGVTASFRF